MDIIRGTTPIITFKVTNDVDLTNVTQVWVYLTQQNKPKVFKDISSVTVDAQTKNITTHLSQSDTLELRAGVDWHPEPSGRQDLLSFHRPWRRGRCAVGHLRRLREDRYDNGDDNAGFPLRL